MGRSAPAQWRRTAAGPPPPIDPRRTVVGPEPRRLGVPLSSVTARPAPVAALATCRAAVGAELGDPRGRRGGGITRQTDAAQKRANDVRQFAFVTASAWDARQPVWRSYHPLPARSGFHLNCSKSSPAPAADNSITTAAIDHDRTMRSHGSRVAAAAGQVT